VSATQTAWIGVLLAIGAALIAVAAIPAFARSVRRLVTAGATALLGGIALAVVGSLPPSTTPADPEPVFVPVDLALGRAADDGGPADPGGEGPAVFTAARNGYATVTIRLASPGGEMASATCKATVTVTDTEALARVDAGDGAPDPDAGVAQRVTRVCGDVGAVYLRAGAYLVAADVVDLDRHVRSRDLESLRVVTLDRGHGSDEP